MLRPCLCSADSTGPSHTALERLSRATHAHTHTRIKSAHKRSLGQPHAPYSDELITLDNNPVFSCRYVHVLCVVAPPPCGAGTRFDQHGKYKWGGAGCLSDRNVIKVGLRLRRPHSRQEPGRRQPPRPMKRRSSKSASVCVAVFAAA